MFFKSFSVTFSIWIFLDSIIFKHVSFAIWSKSVTVLAIYVIDRAFDFAIFSLTHLLINDVPCDTLSPIIGIRDTKVSIDADKRESVLIVNLPLAIRQEVL